jgi:protein gp37
MSTATAIEWTDATWNPIVGCSIVSPGCTRCYAMTMAARIERMNPAAAHYAGLTRPSKAGAVWTGKVALAPDSILLAPLRWKKPRRIFVNSMSDLFHEDVPDEWIDRIFAVMALTPQHTYQVLTKRAQRMHDYVTDEAFGRIVLAMMGLTDQGVPTVKEACRRAGIPYAQPKSGNDWWPLPNVWLGVSTERQQEADERIPWLLKTPAAMHFLSCEPLLGPVMPWTADIMEKLGSAIMESGIDWVIAGGESGPGARPSHPDWFRSLRGLCAATRVPFFFKQWGEWAPGENVERQTGTVSTATWFDGGWSFDRENLANEEGHVDDEPDVYRVGKKAAGALLDGREHREFPS